MWEYEKKLQYPINIKKKDLKMAKYLVTQYGGSNGELAAALRYLNQRYTMPDERGKALLTDIGTEELGHIEMIATMVSQLTKDATIDEIKFNFLKSQSEGGRGQRSASNTTAFVYAKEKNGYPAVRVAVKTPAD